MEQEFIPSWRKQQIAEQKVTRKKVNPFVFVLSAILVVLVIGGFFTYRILVSDIDAQNLDPNTPYDVKFTQVGSDTFTIQWKTNAPTIGFIKYGISQGSLDLIGQANENSADSRKLHEIKVEGLDRGVTYYVEVHSDAQAFGEAGEPIEVRTLD